MFSPNKVFEFKIDSDGIQVRTRFEIRKLENRVLVVRTDEMTAKHWSASWGLNLFSFLTRIKQKREFRVLKSILERGKET